MCLGNLPAKYGAGLNAVLYPTWQEYSTASHELERDVVFEKDLNDAYAQAVQTAWEAGLSGQPMSVYFATDLLEMYCDCRTYRNMNVQPGCDWTQIVTLMRELLGGEKWGEHEPGWVEWAYQPTKHFMAEFHLRFENIHPLMDGNGRWGRLLLAYLYGKMGLRPTLIVDREVYLHAMRTQDTKLLASLL